MMEATSSGKPLIELREIGRTYGEGDAALTVLRDINLRIEAGEMVAIVGASGSGKSTLMNLLGCLDEPSQGTYEIAGRHVLELGPDELAKLRREHFGFVFQRYQLLTDLTALSNVETPAIYAGTSSGYRRRRAQKLLERIGLGERLHHRPGQLSGGQQQRVSIARALMNGGQVILADEPTGALDSRSGEELMDLFAKLNEEGHTIIIVTHDMHVAEHAKRIIEIKDGRIIADRQNPPLRARKMGALDAGETLPARDAVTMKGWLALDQLREASRIALLSAITHRLRTFLTMLGIIIGIASVVCVVALGEGSKERILSHISAFGTNTIDIYPGRTAGDTRAGMVHTLVLSDMEALREQDYVDSVTPVVMTSSTLRSRNLSVNAQVMGVGGAYFRVHGMTILEGTSFDGKAVALQAQQVVIDEKTRQTLFTGLPAIGQILLIGSTPARVIGVARPPDIGMGGGTLNVWLPYTSVMSRITGQFYLQSATVRISEVASPPAAIDAVTALLKRRHGRQDFTTFSSDALRTLVTQTNENLSLLVSAIAFISLLVGGIGVMNIMLVSVTERIHEIGVRMAVGARRADIRNQFLIEAVMICLMGGAIGIFLALGIGFGLSSPTGRYHTVFSMRSFVVAFLSASLIGMIFGFMPARRAARMNLVDALARE